ncbi:MAG: hypothetical protein AAGA86_05805 [Bacteroidota bacterium]
MKPERKIFWNSIVVLTIAVCLSVLLAHYKNWVIQGSDNLKLLSGFYYKKVAFSDLDSVQWVARIPPMERLNGFSALGKEKGVFREFKDSLTDKEVYVYVDNLEHQKIKLVYKDSIHFFVNLKDSLDTDKMYQLLKRKVDGQKE